MSAPWFELPKHLEATAPPEPRDNVRLLVTFREKDGIAHARFRDLPSFLRTGDLLVVNDSATLPAALTATRPNGDEIALHLSTRLHETHWSAEPRRVAPTPGERLELPAGGAATLLKPYRDSSRLWLARLELPDDHVAYLHQHGRPIHYDYVTNPWPIDAYQTIFARVPGSAEMPSAARPFSPTVVAALRHKGVKLATITLHTGVASLESHEPPYPEWFSVPDSTAAIIHDALEAGHRIIAVGTTVVRALETWGSLGGGARSADSFRGFGGPSERSERGPRKNRLGGPGERSVPRPGHAGWADLVITPERGVRIVHGLLTGFHEPAATHLHMLEAIAGAADVRRAYRAALTHSYLWHEFGDVHLIL